MVGNPEVVLVTRSISGGPVIRPESVVGDYSPVAAFPAGGNFMADPKLLACVTICKLDEVRLTVIFGMRRNGFQIQIGVLQWLFSHSENPRKNPQTCHGDQQACGQHCGNGGDHLH